VTQFATSDDFAARLGLTLTSDEETRAETLLEMASGLIQHETHQTIALVDDDTLTVRSVYDDRFRLPERPVVDVSSVTLTLIGLLNTSFDVPDTQWYVDRDELVRTSFPLGFQQAFAGYQRGWLGPLYEMAVVYTHGFETIPPIVRSVTLEMAVRAWVNPGAVARESVGDTQTVYDNMRFSPTGLLMTDLEKQLVNDVIGRQSGTVVLR
jgi:hypothetical protein